MNDTLSATAAAVTTCCTESVPTIESLLLSLPDEQNHGHSHSHSHSHSQNDDDSNTSATTTATATNTTTTNRTKMMTMTMTSSFKRNDSIGRGTASWCGTTRAKELLLERIDSPSLNTPQKAKKSSLRMKCNDSISSALSLTSLTETSGHNSHSNSNNNSNNNISSSSITSIYLNDVDDHHHHDGDCGYDNSNSNNSNNKLTTSTTSIHNTTSKYNTMTTTTTAIKSKTVRFSRKVKVRKTRSHLDYTPRQIKNCWYQQYEIDKIKDSCFYEVTQFRNQQKRKHQQQKQKQQIEHEQRNGKSMEKTTLLSTCDEEDEVEDKDEDQDQQESNADQDGNKDNDVNVNNEEDSTTTYCMRGLESYIPTAYKRKKRLRNKASQIVFDIEDDGGDDITIAEYYYSITKKYQLVAHIIALQDERDAYYELSTTNNDTDADTEADTDADADIICTCSK